MRRNILICVLIFTHGGSLYAQQSAPSNEEQKAQIEQTMKIIEQSNKTLETLSSSSGIVTNLTNTLQSLKEKEQTQVNQQTVELDQKINEALQLLEKKELFKAKIKAMQIAWTPIGRKEIDELKIKSYNEIREQLLKQANQ